MRQETSQDALGNAKTDWVEQFQQRGSREFLRAGEEIIAGRLQGTSRILANVYQSEQMDQVTPEWRMVDVVTQCVYNIREIQNDWRQREYTILAESGVAT